jgi:hypothetical protein
MDANKRVVNAYPYLPKECLRIPQTSGDLKTCMNSQLWRLNNLYFIINERGESVLFRLNAVQYKYYSARHYFNIILKSRQHGITTLCCLLILDTCLFVDNTATGIIAHKLTATLDIFRNKIKYPYDHLPKAILAQKEAIKDDACQLILNNSSSITVATSLRSGTYQMIHVSEHGKICAKTPQKAEELKTGTLETVHEGSSITIESTAEGRTGDFYDWFTEADVKAKDHIPLGKLDYKRHFFAWYEDPKNTTDPQYIEITDNIKEYFVKLSRGLDYSFSPGQIAWYANKAKKLGILIYREHPTTPDEAFKSLITGSYYGTEIAIAREQGRVLKLYYEPRIPVYTFWDIGHKHTAIWFVQYAQTQKRHIDYYEDNDGLGMAAYAEILRNKGYRYGGHFGPPDMKTSNARSIQTGRDLVDVAKEAGIEFVIIAAHHIETRIKTTIDEISSCLFDNIKCDAGLKSLELYRAEWNEVTEDFGKKPFHDKYSHGADAFGYEMMQYKWGEIGNKFMGDLRVRDFDYLGERKQKVQLDYDLLAI